MKPIAIFRHAHSEGPGYFASFLEARHIPWVLIAIDDGAAVPNAITDFSGLVFMGGPMSVNDDLPWLAPAFELIRAAVASNTPVLGHCLGGQLIAKALGAHVTRNPTKEIGWGRVEAVASDVTTTWLGTGTTFDAFHWHGETFSLPAGATRILSSAHCDNQAFVIGPHLAMQCHVEMTEAMIRDWCDIGRHEITDALTGKTPSPAVQTPAEIHALNADKLPPLHAVAEKLYCHWLSGLSA